MTARWRITHEDDVARIAPARGPARMDLAVHAAWDVPAPRVEGLSRRRFRVEHARQIRQDLWRALQRTRGFVPVVEVMTDHSGEGAQGDGAVDAGAEAGAVRVMVTAGGRIDAPQAPRAAMEETVHALLSNPENRRRWRRHAARRARPRPGDAL
ncbi:hypothetical protein ACQ5SO_20125 [Rhodovulum sp. DZ06]|uniref:hypothetical protein n=1 Tax=Rhodovulum sp. DZ06 TaxID=3425126 RepID=UPI003D340071